MSKIIAILQPMYLPWLGYFEQMAIADLFVFMDDVQYTKKDWRNRNRIKTANGPCWLTVPVRKHSRNALIRDIEINDREPWARRHLRSIDFSYRKRPGFEPLYNDLSAALSTEPRSTPEKLWELDCRLIALLARYLEVETPTAFSSAVPRGVMPEDKNGRILEICQAFDADLLYDGASAASFIDVQRFQREGVEVIFQDYEHPVYPQAFGEFISHMSALDLIMNTGSEAPKIFRSTMANVRGLAIA